ncbi:TIGR02281 family clan AA aspartic protease [Methyloglobulus sp.]|uniref:retropepsin-like aspartic protease family protein n=1 Tax=Methyloglobulus sp. TaxID=2518622 RepID=UPI0039899BF9
MQKNVIQSLFIAILAASSMSGWSQEMIYKCKNQQGILIYQNSACKDNAQTVTSWAQKERANPPVSESGTEQDKDKKKPSPVLKLKQNAAGHYATEGSVDGNSLNFVVDTGASFVSLPESLAHGAQIYCDNKINMNTANGVVDACTAKIKKLQFGPFVVKDVPVVIVPNLSQPLLGMNVLQLFKVGQEKGEMQISILDK